MGNQIFFKPKYLYASVPVKLMFLDILSLLPLVRGLKEDLNRHIIDVMVKGQFLRVFSCPSQIDECNVFVKSVISLHHAQIFIIQLWTDLK